MCAELIESSKMHRDKTHNIDRDDLYELIWSKPAVEVAKQFGISDVAVGKICKKLNIPKVKLTGRR